MSCGFSSLQRERGEICRLLFLLFQEQTHTHANTANTWKWDPLSPSLRLHSICNCSNVKLVCVFLSAFSSALNWLLLFVYDNLEVLMCVFCFEEGILFSAMQSSASSSSSSFSCTRAIDGSLVVVVVLVIGKDLFHSFFSLFDNEESGVFFVVLLLLLKEGMKCSAVQWQISLCLSVCLSTAK